MSGILKVENIGVKRGGASVLDIASLDLQEGEVLSLIGPNGSGKSSLLLTLAGLLTPERGRILFRNQPLSSLKKCSPIVAESPWCSRKRFYSIRRFIKMSLPV